VCSRLLAQAYFQNRSMGSENYFFGKSSNTYRVVLEGIIRSVGDGRCWNLDVSIRGVLRLRIFSLKVISRMRYIFTWDSRIAKILKYSSLNYYFYVISPDFIILGPRENRNHVTIV
jgi:hypothetical protein